MTNRIALRTWVPAVLLMLVSAPVFAAGFQQSETIRSDRLVVSNLIGAVRIEGHAGSDFEVDVAVRGDDASPELVSIAVEPGHPARLTVEFPLDEHRKYVYPEGHSSTSFSVSGDGDDGGWLASLFGRNRIKISSNGSGLEVWADVTVRVPAGSKLELRHGVGRVTADSVAAGLVLDGRSSTMSVADLEGDLSIDVGSGRVRVDRVRGAVTVDSGSGSIAISGVEGPRVSVDSGSGEVHTSGITTERLSIDTGSGSVTAREIRADSLSIDTGSGSVELQLNEISAGGYQVDTGSGSITLELPAGASARVDADTGSGGIHVSLDGAQIVHQERDELALRLGGGDARVSLSTGSGGIRIK